MCNDDGNLAQLIEKAKIVSPTHSPNLLPTKKEIQAGYQFLKYPNKIE